MTNVRKSRNEATGLEKRDIFADAPTSAGQSTSSLFKQDQVRKKFNIEDPVVEEKKQTPERPKNKLKEIFTQSSKGLSGRNLYFNQIRNEITLSESQTGKHKCLPDYQNAKYSNKRNGLVAGYGANTN